MPICAVSGCSNRYDSKRNVFSDSHINKLRFFFIPKILTNQGEETRQLSEERRRLWKDLNRADISTEKQWNATIICSRHFVNGTKAYLHLRNSPSWLPTLHLGYPKQVLDPEKANERYKRQQARNKRPASAQQSSKKRKWVENETPAESSTCASTQDLGKTEELEHSISIESAAHALRESGAEGGALFINHVNGNDVSSQTDLTAQTISQVFADNAARMLEATAKKTHLSIYDRQYYTSEKEKIKFYTGLPNLAIFDLVLDFVEPSMSNQTLSLTKENELLICLIKIRLNYQFQDIAYQLKVSQSTIQRSFHRTLDVLATRLQFLIKWPAREELQVSMRMCFRENFGKKVAVIVDCFELLAQKPFGQGNQILTYSNYKHNQTAKYLIGITPQGSISFISDAYGGRASDKYMIEDSGFLQYIMPGDILMADRGFNIEDEVMFYQAKLLIPNFTHGKKQLHPLEVENTRNIASVRIHVERVIGLVRRKFGILQKEMPMDFMKKKNGEHNPTIDKIVQVCCCIVNLHQSIVPFD